MYVLRIFIIFFRNFHSENDIGTRYGIIGHSTTSLMTNIQRTHAREAGARGNSSIRTMPIKQLVHFQFVNQLFSQ